MKEKYITEKENNIIRNVTYLNDQKSTVIRTDGAVPYIQFENLAKFDDICHGFSTRLGGVSVEHLSSLNLSFHRDDVKESVMENHRRLAKSIGYNHERLVFPQQVHEDYIRVCDENDAGKGIVLESDIFNTDGLVTNVKNLPLITFYADCVPLYFYDPVKKVVGMAHSGWRGTVKQIGKKMIEKMGEVYGTKPEDVQCAIGPSICQKCYEVSEDVIIEFKKIYNEEQISDMIIDKGNGKYLLDLHKACRYNFILAGVKPENICTTDICTCCNGEFLYSHRASKGRRGNLGGVIMLKG